jgi:enamine deaminase RidA (YjgF/YER057c/UK114 family)
MERRIVNPWTWQDQLGFVQANELQGPQRWLICAGQAGVDADGNPVAVGDMRGQIRQALDNLETVLTQAGFTLANVMRLTIYTTDADRFLAEYDEMVGRLAAAGCRPAATLLGVARLAFPDLLVEIEATAVA